VSAKRCRGLTRKITLDHALSYDRTVPNRRGVTALVELNGTGAYERRYERAKRLLENGDVKGNPMRFTAKQKSAMRRMPKGRAAAFKRMLAASGYRRNESELDRAAKRISAKQLGVVYGEEKPKKKAKTTAKKKSSADADKKAAQAAGKKHAAQRAKAARTKPKHSTAEIAASLAAGHAARIAAEKPKRQTKAAKAKAKAKQRHDRATFYKYHRQEGWSDKKIREAYAKYLKAHPISVRAHRPGGYQGLIMKGYGRPRPTYMYRSKGGAVRHIPEFAVLGYKSLDKMKKADKAKVDARREKIVARRKRAATAETKRIMAGHGIFSPNADVMTFDEWKGNQMKANKKAANKGTKAAFMAAQKRKGASEAQAEARWNFKQMVAGKKAGKKAPKKKAKKSAAKKRTAAKKAAPKKATKKAVRKGKLTKTQRRAAAKKGWAKRRRQGTAKAKAHKPAKKAAKKGAKRKSRRMVVKRITISAYSKNRKRRRHHVRRYHKNIAAAYVSDMKDVLKIGAIVVVGYATHRLLSKLFDEYAMSKITQLQTGTIATWRPLLSATVVAAVGVPLTAYLAGKTESKNLILPIAAGMAASLLHNALLTALGATGNEQAAKVAGYLSAYPDAGSRAYNGMGSYYSFQPRQVFGRQGTGEFYEVLPQSGFGLDSRQLNQAAAGFGAPVMQAAAGFGAEVMQAAAGTGEYVVYGAEGIGEYEEVPATGGQVGAYDGVLPTLDSAEYALNVAEAAAGLGDLPMQSTVDPVGGSQPIAGAPGGSRAGVLQGGDGIFGG
jgi:colicin import membrane protein